MRARSTRKWRRPEAVVARIAAAALAALALAAGAAHAAEGDDEAPVALEGTLLKARTSGVVTIAYREASVPFSFLSPRREPIGYSIDLCRALVEAMSTAVSRPLETRWLAVTSETRIEAIESGRADLECGSTTANRERARRVAFSPTIFVAGTKLLVKRGSPVKSFRDLRGRTVVVTAGTTNEQAMRELAKRFAIDMKIETARDHAESYARLAEGRADAFATDDVLLAGLLAQQGGRNQFQVVGEFLSYDPYGIMYRRGDAQMKRLVEATFRELAQDGEVERLYKRWFLKRLPGGESLDLPMSAQLENLVQAMATPEPD